MSIKYYTFANNICNNLQKRSCGPELSASIKYNFTDLPNINGQNSKIMLVKSDVVKQLIEYAQMNALIVNPTHDQACGEWDSGISGYEESLAYRSTLSMSLRDEFYPIKKDELVYSPCVHFFLDDQYNVMKSIKTSVVSLLASRMDFSVENDVNHMRNTFQSIFQIAQKYDHKCIIINAFGVKEDNNPIEIAKLLNEFVHTCSIIIVFDDDATMADFKQIIKN